MWCQQNWGTAGASIVWSCADNVANRRRWLSYDTSGVFGGFTRCSADDLGASFGVFSAPGQAGAFNDSASKCVYRVRDIWVPNSSYAPFIGGGVGGAGGSYRSFVSFGALVYPAGSNLHAEACISLSEDYDTITGGAPRSRVFKFSAEFNNPSISFADDQGQGHVIWQPTSDFRLKGDVNPVDGRHSLRNIERMRPVTFHFLADENKTIRRGFVAQELEKIDPEYVHTISNHITGKEYLSLDVNPLLMDALAAIKLLAQDMRTLKAQNQELQSQLMNLSK
ncbi:tail fiber domain-containing protein [Salmonella enterica]|nr:tail fiber domain-containing protein [Salmonella enterica]EKK6596270.1 tail fiber domain-containing protein [Salmonella enterica]